MSGFLKRFIPGQYWQRLAQRDRQMLVVLLVFLTGVMIFTGIWQPTLQRMTQAERDYQRQWALASEINRAQAVRPLRVHQPLALHVSESAASAGLELSQLGSDSERLRATLTGDARALLGWLTRLEHEGVKMQSLTLEKQDNHLVATVSWGVD